MAGGLYEAGFIAKVLVNGSLYGVARCTVRDATPSGDTSNTLGLGVGVSAPDPSFATSRRLLRKAIVTVTAPSYDVGIGGNMFNAPFRVHSGDLIALEILPGGVGLSGFVIPAFLVTETDLDIDAKMLEPCGFTGETVGPFLDPGQE